MSAVDKALREFQGAWERSERPDLTAYLASVSESDRDELAGRVADWLETAESPAYPEAVRSAIADEPSLVAALEVAELQRRPVAERLPLLRERAGLALGELASRLIGAFGLGSPSEPRATAYLQELERGDLDEQRLSRRLTDRLAEILDAPGSALAPSPRPAAAMFRAEDETVVGAVAGDFEALAEAAMAPAPKQEPMDDLDRLFRGGPEG